MWSFFYLCIFNDFWRDLANTLFNIRDFWLGRQFLPNLDFIVTIFIDPRHKRTFCIWLGVRYDKYKARTDEQKEI